MVNFVEVFVPATGRNEIVPEDWLGDPILGTDSAGNNLERVQPATPDVAEDRPTAGDTHKVIDDFAKKVGVTFPEDAKTKEQKLAVLDELAPARPGTVTAAPPIPESQSGVALVGPVSSESTIPAFQNTDNNQASAEDEEN